MTVLTIVLSNSTSNPATTATNAGFVRDFNVSLPRALSIGRKRARLLEATCFQLNDATTIKLLDVSIPFLETRKSNVVATSSNPAATFATAANAAYDADRSRSTGLLLSLTGRSSHTVYPDAMEFDVSSTRIPKHFVVKVRSGIDGTSAQVNIRYLILKFAIDTIDV